MVAAQTCASRRDGNVLEIDTPPFFLIWASYLVVPRLERLMMLGMLPVPPPQRSAENLREPREVGEERISEFLLIP